MKTKKGLIFNPLFILSILALVIGFFLSSGFGLLAFGVDPYYNIEDDFTFFEKDKWQSEITSAKCQIPGRWKTYGGSTKVENGNLVLKATDGAKAKVTYLKNIKEFDLKTKVYLFYQHPGEASYGSSGNSGFSLLLNEEVILSETTFPTVTSSSGSFIIELVKDFEEEDVYNIKVNGRTIGSKRILDEEARLSYQISGGSGSCQYPGNSRLEIKYLRSRNYESCDLEDDEVVFTDKFTSGSVFDINDLSFKAVKFCPTERPLIKRNIATGGERANVEGTIYQKLRNGETIIVPENYVYEIIYGVDFFEGMPLSNCPSGEYKNTLTGFCEEVILEKKDVVEFVTETEVVFIERNDVVFDNSFQIADYKITSEKPIYSCSQTKSNSLDREEADCWRVKVFFNGESFDLKPRESKVLNNFLTLQALPEARLRNGKVQPDFVNKFILSVGDLIEVEGVGEPKKNYFVLYDSKREIPLKVSNQFGLLDRSGFKVTRTNKLLNEEKTRMISTKFVEGDSVVGIPIESGEYGKADYELIAYYKVNGQTLFDDNKIKVSYEVVDEIPKDVEVVTEKITEKETTWQKFWRWLKSLFR